MPSYSGTITSSQGTRTLDITPNDVITFTPTSGTYTVEYPIGTVAISASSTTQALIGRAQATQIRVSCQSGLVAYSCVDGLDDTKTIPPASAVLVSSGTPFLVQSKVKPMGLKPLGFNSYELIYNHVINGNYTYSNLFTYFNQSNANLVRVLYPVFQDTEWTGNVFASGIPSGEITDAAFRSTFLLRSDAVIDAAEQANVRILFCLFWNAPGVCTLFGETLIQGLQVGSKTHNFMLRFARWFFTRYGGRRVLGAYSFFNEVQYDATGVANPTPANLGAVTSSLVAIGKELAPASVATSDFSFLVLSTLTARPTFNSEFANIATIASSLDALGVHLYGYGPSLSGQNYMGVDAVATAAFGPLPANTLGYEGLDSLVSAWRSVANQLGMQLWITECGVPTDVESAANFRRARRVISGVLRNADIALLWNAADLASPISNQVVWQIRPGQTRGDTYKTLAIEMNAAGVSPALPSGGGTAGLLAALKPYQCFTATRSAGATVRVTSTAAMTTSTQAVLFWIRKDAALNNFENLIYCRDAGNLFGFLYLAGSTATVDPEYIDFRGGSGSTINTSGQTQRTNTGEWHHFAFVVRAVNAQLAVEVWVDGLFFRILSAPNPYAGITAATTLYFGGGNTNGAPVSMQDICLASTVTPDDIYAHMRGAVLPQATLHLRANSETVLDLSRGNVAVTVGSGVTVVPA